jgi:hypothetical protein
MGFNTQESCSLWRRSGIVKKASSLGSPHRHSRYRSPLFPSSIRFADCSRDSRGAVEYGILARLCGEVHGTLCGNAESDFVRL